MEDTRQVIVIGSGPAGAAAARELVSQGISVTMLEAGIEHPSGFLARIGGQNIARRKPAVREDGAYGLSGDPQTRCYANFSLGGLSNCWTGAVPRFAPEDFTEGSRLHERYLWPIRYDDLERYYEKVERYLGITADPRDVPQLPGGHVDYRHTLPEDWSTVVDAARRQGQGFTTYPLADGPRHLLVARGTAFNSYSCVVKPLLRSSHFALRTGAVAIEVCWSKKYRRAEGVLYFCRRTRTFRRIRAQAVVVACGPLATTKLLHNSVSTDFPQGIGNTQGLLGLYLHDHPREWWPFEMDRPRTILSPAAYLTRLPYQRSTPLLATSWTLGTTSLGDRIRARFGQVSTSVGVQMIGTVVPSASSWAKPAPTRKDEFGFASLDVHIQYTLDEVNNVICARDHLIDLLQDAGIRARLGDVAPTLFPGSIAHYGGTARMHANPQYGVTDAWNRVYGAPSVLVVDASCFTTAAEKNPTLTVMAIAARAAHRLAQDLRQG